MNEKDCFFLSKQSNFSLPRCLIIAIPKFHTSIFSEERETEIERERERENWSLRRTVGKNSGETSEKKRNKQFRSHAIFKI